VHLVRSGEAGEGEPAQPPQPQQKQQAPQEEGPLERELAKLAALVELAGKADATGLRAIAINPVSSSPKALARYRDLAVLAIEAREGHS
jgi:hypothetical protein